MTAIHPSASTFIDGDSEEIVISLCYRDQLMIRPITSLVHASEQTIDELRRVCDLLSAAADRLQGGAV